MDGHIYKFLSNLCLSCQNTPLLNYISFTKKYLKLSFYKKETYNRKKKGGFYIYKRLFNKSRQLNKQIREIKKELKELPNGKLICCGDSWYRSDGHKKTYIKKKDKNLAEQLAIKKYLSTLLEDLEKEKSATDMYLRHCPKEKKVDSLFKNHDELQNLLSKHFSPLSKELDDWMKSPYEHNLIHTEHLKQKVCSKEFVRSKSEAMIAKVLKQNKIPYRYECALNLGEIQTYPDFTIRHPKTGEYFYWEHFGLLDKADYVENMHKKMRHYTSNNIMPGINLIATYETQNKPLTFEIIEMLVNYYFL